MAEFMTRQLLLTYLTTLFSLPYTEPLASMANGSSRPNKRTMLYKQIYLLCDAKRRLDSKEQAREKNKQKAM